MIGKHIDLVAIGVLLLSVAAYTRANSLVQAGFEQAQRSGLIERGPRNILVLRSSWRTAQVPACPFSAAFRLTHP